MTSRRKFLTSTACLGGSLVCPGMLSAQQQGVLQVEKLNFLEISVSNPARSQAFYQELFGFPVQSRSGGSTLLKIGSENQFMAIRPVQDSETPGIKTLGYSVPDFSPDRILDTLEASGFRKTVAPDISWPGIEFPMTTWTRSSGEATEVYFSDARGLIVRLTDTSWCGGSGALGNVCNAPEAAPAGMIHLDEINHFTCFVNDGAGANLFYQDFFGLEIQAFQGPNSPVTGIGDGKQFVMYAGPFPGGENAPANIHHASFNMTGFMVDEVLETLTDFGLSDRGERQTGPMMHYISLRMPARGGVEGGTPEVYFTDPDGILMQIQDTSYCGGGGYLGEVCLEN